MLLVGTLSAIAVPGVVHGLQQPDSATTPAGARLAAVGQLQPFRETLLAANASRGGGVVWQRVPDRPDGGAVMRIAAEGAGLTPTPLTPARVAQTVEPAADAGVGRFDGLAIDGQDVLFLWRGTTGGRTAVVLGRFDGASGRIAIEADAPTLADAAGLGGSLVLAETRLIGSGESIWVLVRDLDRAALFRRASGGYGLGRPIELRALQPQRGEPALPDLRSPTAALAPAAAGGLVVTDSAVSAIWTITPDGQVRRVAGLGGLPLGATPAVGLPADAVEGSNSAPARQASNGVDGPLAMIAADTARAPADAHEQSERRGQFPALVWIDSPTGRVRIIGRDSLAAPPQYPVYAMQVAALAPERGGALLAYDRTTGTLFRVSPTAGE